MKYILMIFILLVMSGCYYYGEPGYRQPVNSDYAYPQGGSIMQLPIERQNYEGFGNSGGLKRVDVFEGVRISK